MSEKASANPYEAPRKPASSDLSAAYLSAFKTCIACIGLTALWSLLTHEPLIKLDSTSTAAAVRSWNATTPIYRSPNATIGWHVCPDNPSDTTFYCGFYETPLNWLEVKETPGEADWRKWKGGKDVKDVARIFMRMLPADEGKRVGSLLVNPGGPGGSGNNFVYGKTGKAIKVITEGKFDIIGFDPRGINMTTPRMKDFETAYERALWELRNEPPIIASDPRKPVNLSDPEQHDREMHRMSTLAAQSDLHAELMRHHTTGKARKSMSTPFVVRDMASMVDALGEKDGMLHYWGFSYGTILGAHFAAIMPHRVGRLVLDGVSHSGDYTGGLDKWGKSSMRDSNKVYEQFFIKCAEAGSERCALAARSPSKLVNEDEEAFIKRAAKDLQVNADQFISESWDTPMQVEKGQNGPGLLTAQDLSFVIFRTLYSPAKWQDFATALHEAMSGNATSLKDMHVSPSLSALKNPAVGMRGETDNVFGVPMGETNAQTAILCSDEEPVTKWKLEDFVEEAEDLRERSVTGNEWTSIVIGCKGWTDRPYERYPGPWTQKQGLRDLANPVLWVGNTYDPVTPLKSAERMAAGFGEKNARVLVHDGRGHCTSAEPSLCTAKAIRAYLLNGTLPAEGTVCKPEPGFIFPEEDFLIQSEDALLAAVKDIGEALLG